MLDEAGLGLDVLNRGLQQLTTAERAIVLSQGKSQRVEYVSDNPTRLGAIQTAYKLHKLLGNTEQAQDNRSVTFNITMEDASQLNTLADKLEQLNRRLSLGGGQSGEVTNDNTIDIGNDSGSVDP